MTNPTLQDRNRAFKKLSNLLTITEKRIHKNNNLILIYNPERIPLLCFKGWKT
jgi:hypothetical protein